MKIIIQKKSGEGVNVLDYPGKLKNFGETERHPTIPNKWVTKVGNNESLESLNSKSDYEVLEFIPEIDNAIVEREWRNSELLRTDYFIMLPDYPGKTALKAYRKLLRDYPALEGFPNGDRPSD